MVGIDKIHEGFRAGTQFRAVIEGIFEKNHKQIEKFAKKNRLPLPESLLGFGEVGPAFNAGPKTVVKLLCQAFNNSSIDEDLEFCKYAIKYKPKSFVRILKIMNIKKAYDGENRFGGGTVEYPAHLIWMDRVSHGGSPQTFFGDGIVREIKELDAAIDSLVSDFGVMKEDAVDVADFLKNNKNHPDLPHMHQLMADLEVAALRNRVCYNFHKENFGEKDGNLILFDSQMSIGE